MKKVLLYGINILFLPTISSAAIVNFHNNIQGNLFNPGEGTVGTFSGSLHYNLGDDGVPVRDTNGNIVLDASGNVLYQIDKYPNDRFPDKLKHDPRTDKDGNIITALLPPGITAPLHSMQYTPYSAFSDEYYIDIALSLTSGSNIGNFNYQIPIDDINVRYEEEQNFSVCHTGITFVGSGIEIGFDRSNTCPSSFLGLPDIPDFLHLEDALLSLDSFSSSDTLLTLKSPLTDTDLGGLSFFQRIASTGPLTANVSEPSTLWIILSGLTGFSLYRRKPSASGQGR